MMMYSSGSAFIPAWRLADDQLRHALIAALRPPWGLAELQAALDRAPQTWSAWRQLPSFMTMNGIPGVDVCANPGELGDDDPSSQLRQAGIPFVGNRLCCSTYGGSGGHSTIVFDGVHEWTGSWSSRSGHAFTARLCAGRLVVDEEQLLKARELEAALRTVLGPGCRIPEGSQEAP